MKIYRRFIRIHGRMITSPRFTKKNDAENWYHEMRRKKQLLRDGVLLDESDDITFINYSRQWMRKRMENYPPATWKADKQRLQTYILPLISEIELNKVTPQMVKSLLLRISEEGFLKPKFKIADSTRTRVKALLSAIFSDCLNEDPPLVKFNPVLGIKIKEKRMGKKKPRHLENKEQCLKFLESAKEIGPQEYLVACLFLMSGVRKQELIALRWECLNSRAKTLKISEKYEQTTNSIRSGTKGGENSTRIVPISAQLVALLNETRKTSKFSKDQNFIVSKPNGSFYGGRQISEMIERIRAHAKLDISAHGLRHTFGREFALNTGNLKALQSILGHSSSSTTDIYSELAGDRLKGFGEAVSFDIDVKRSEG